jgi:hypothetical protein
MSRQLVKAMVRAVSHRSAQRYRRFVHRTQEESRVTVDVTIARLPRRTYFTPRSAHARERLRAIAPDSAYWMLGALAATPDDAARLLSLLAVEGLTHATEH